MANNKLKQFEYKKLLKSIQDMKFPKKVKCNKTAVLVIDMESEFCSTTHEAKRGNENTEKLAGKMDAVLRKFRNASLPIYLIRYPDKDKMNVIEDTFHKFSPDESDHIINKDHSSAFKGSDLKDIFNKAGVKNVLLCGVNRSECVKETALDGIRDKFNIFLLDDLTCDGKGFKRKNEVEAEEKMTEKGVVYAESGTLFNDMKP